MKSFYTPNQPRNFIMFNWGTKDVMSFYYVEIESNLCSIYQLLLYPWSTPHEILSSWKWVQRRWSLLGRLFVALVLQTGDSSWIKTKRGGSQASSQKGINIKREYNVSFHLYVEDLPQAGVGRERSKSESEDDEG